MSKFDDSSSTLGEPIRRIQSLKASKEKVWQFISTPGILAECHPFCQSNPVERWPGVGSRDRIIYYSGLVLDREFTAWLEGEGYDLVASSENDMRFNVSWRISEGELNQGDLILTIRPVVIATTRDRTRQYSRLLGRYLEQVLKGFDFYVRTGKPVYRNQFGSHRLFSPPIPTR